MSRHLDETISPATIALMTEKAPMLKEMIGDITSTIISICRSDITSHETEEISVIGKKGGKEVLDYIDKLAAENEDDFGFRLNIDYGIAIFGECVSLVEVMRDDIKHGKLDPERCKYFVRTSQLCINYLDAYAKKAS